VILVFLAGTFGIGFAFAARHCASRCEHLANLRQFVFLIRPPTSSLCGLAGSGEMGFGRSALILWMLSVRPDGLSGRFPELAPIETEITIVVVFGLIMP
jgi:hypothetical protein